MAKLPALVSSLSDVLGIDRKTVDYVARFIREHGYIETTGRGAGAADVSVPEVVNLLIALNAAQTTRESISVIDQFRTLKRHASWEVDDFKKTRAKWFSAEDFGTFMNELVRDLPSIIDIFDYMNTNFYPHCTLSQCFEMRVIGLEICFKSLSAEATIFVSDENGKAPQVVRRFVTDTDLFMQGFYRSRANASFRSDREVVVTIGHKTLIALWHLLFPAKLIPALEEIR